MTPTPADAMTPARRLRSIFSGSVGNLVEWYDWYVYAAFSLYFAEVFFPGGDRTSQLLKTAVIFAVGFLMRPLGGWLLGRYADRHGRKRALMLSVVMMCAGSLIIACTPGRKILTTTSWPPGKRAAWTCAIDAAASACSSNSAKISRSGRPNARSSVSTACAEGNGGT